MLLIKNVKVVDGSGQSAYPADVLVSGNKISAIGNFPNKKVEQIIEGLGGYLAPGFINVRVNSDHYLTLFSNPSQKHFLLQGVTSIIGGHCGSSLAPVLYGSLESLRKWVDTSQINVNWHSMEEFIEVMDKLPLGVNFGTLIGHSTIRRALVGDDQRDLTEKELKVFQSIIKEALEEGALGLSTGLEFSHSQQTPYKEIKLLVNILPKYNAVYTTHLRNAREELYASVNETLNLYKETGAKIIISHFVPHLKFTENFDKSFDLINKSSDKMDFHFDVHPFKTSAVAIYTLLPYWIRKGTLENMLSAIKNSAAKQRIVKEFPKFRRGDLIVAYSPGQSFLTGKSITSANELLDLMIVSNLRATLLYKNIDYRRLQKIIFSDKALIGSDRDNAFINFLALTGQRKNYPIEKAVKKITSIPAKKFNIKNRGLIKEGYYADLALILNNKIRSVVVNGQIAVNKEICQNTSSGRIIRR